MQVLLGLAAVAPVTACPSECGLCFAGSRGQSDAGLPISTTAPAVTPTASAVAQLGATLQAAVSDKGLGVEAHQKVDKAMAGVNVGLSGGHLQVCH